MGKLMIIPVLSILFILSSFSAKGFSSEKKTLVIGWESWEPFFYRDNSNTITGLDKELLTSIFSRNGYSLEYHESPWARTLKWIEDGKIHVGASSTKTAEREKYAFYSVPYYKETFVLFVRKNESSKYKIRSLKDISLSNFKLGVMRDSVYGEKFSRLMKDPEFSDNVEEVTKDEQNYKKLMSKRIDGFIQEYSRMVTFGKKSGIFTEVEPLLVVEENPQYVMFSKKTVSWKTVIDFNEGLKRIKKDGTYLKIFKKYNLEKFNIIN